MVIYTTLYKAKYLGTMKTILNVIKLFFSVCILQYIVYCMNLMMQIRNVLFFYISSGLSKGLANCLDLHFLVRIISCMCKYIFKEILLEH